MHAISKPISHIQNASLNQTSILID